jgi:hypothetical protein
MTVAFWRQAVVWLMRKIMNKKEYQPLSKEADMKKLLLTALLVVIGLSGMVYATETRVLTMGNANMIVRDVANVSLFPQTISEYPNLFIAENDDDDYFRSVGAHFKLGEGDKAPVLGAYFSSDSYYNWLFYEYGHGDYVYNNNNRIALIYGQELGGNPFGIALRYYHASQQATYDTTYGYNYYYNYEYALTRFEFGAGITLMQKKLELSAGMAMTSWTDKEYFDTIYTDYSKPKGNFDFAFVARYWMDPIGNYTLIPHLTFASEKEGLDLYPGQLDTVGENDLVYRRNLVYENKYTSFDLGLGMNYKASEKILVVGDIGMMLEASKDKLAGQTYDYEEGLAVLIDTSFESKWNYTSLPYFRLGLDAEVFSWLDIRAGVETWWVGHKYQPGRNTYEYYEYELLESKYNNVETDTYLGACFHWNNLSIDALLDPQFLSRGPYFITGANDNNDNDFAWQTSLVYHF